jgi:hypothetical protein
LVETARGAEDRRYSPRSRFRVTEALPEGFFDSLAPSLVIEPGQTVTVLPERSRSWPAFVLIRDARGGRGWVPERCLRLEGDRGRVLHAYDTATLDPVVGDVLELIEADLPSGWLWCRDTRGKVGWFPTRALEAVE